MLHCVGIEVRQRLCCANVFLKYGKSLEVAENFKLNIKETKIQLETPKCKIDILVNKYFKITPHTLSNLIVDTGNASFRIGIEDIHTQGEDDKTEIRSGMQLNLAEQDEATGLQCSNCEALLAVEQKYEKIREFPSGMIDASDFFCHHGPSFKDVLIPSIKDLFYGFEFIVLNMTSLEKGVRVFPLTTKSQIQRLMLKAIEETSLPSPEPLLRHMHFTKVLIEATFPNRQQQYLLMHILEKQLPILSNRSEVESNVVIEHQEIDLYENKAFKILYRLITKEMCDDAESYNTKWPALLDYWQQNVLVVVKVFINKGGLRWEEGSIKVCAANIYGELDAAQF
ncbi:hypothetical protein DOY81_003047 [Sarcophaga bullata]|nr:hypothetical protein DOY81_003047 [Sarcophaga bullata]